jgi:hypothetical protein
MKTYTKTNELNDIVNNKEKEGTVAKRYHETVLHIVSTDRVRVRDTSGDLHVHLGDSPEFWGEVNLFGDPEDIVNLLSDALTQCQALNDRPR